MSDEQLIFHIYDNISSKIKHDVQPNKSILNVMKVFLVIMNHFIKNIIHI